MLELLEYTQARTADWDAFATEYGSIWHTIAFKNLLQKSFGYQCPYHYLADEQGRIQALLPLVSARNIMQAKVGISLPFINHLDFCSNGTVDNERLFAFYQQLQEKYDCQYLQLRLRTNQPLAANWVTNTDNATFLLPLAGCEQDILALSTGSNRNHTRKVYKNDYFEVSFAQNNLLEFYKVYQKRMHELGSPAPSLEFFQAFFHYFSENAFLLTVLDKCSKRVIGGMLLIKSAPDNTLYYPYGANLVEYNNKYLNNFMYFEAAKFGQTLGMDYLDLGRSPLDSGTYRFKKQWGATPVTLSYLTCFAGKATVPGKDNMAAFIKLWQLLPLPLVNFLGARLIKNVLP